jgi:hypothetical protein
MALDPADPIDQQIRETRELFDHLDDRYMALVASFQMLKPLMADDPLVERLRSAGKYPGASIVAKALFNTCILDCHTLLKDGSETNPSIRTLVRPFLRGNRLKNGDSLDRLATLFSQWPIYWPEAPGEPWPPELIQAWKDRHDQENEARRREFWETIDALALDWGQLQRASEQLVDVRNQWIAHNEVERDPVMQNFRPPDLPTIGALYAILEEVVPVIVRSVAHLALILRNTDIGPEEFERLMKQHADIFWETQPSIR